MKKVVYIVIVLGFIISCNSTQKTVTDAPKAAISDTVKIANAEEEYEIIIIDPGFSTFLYGQARPRGYFSLELLEQRNQMYVREWNNRVRLPLSYDPDLYEMEINYDPNVRYGYEVNYLLYNYFVYFQNQYKQRLGGIVPRI